METAAAVGRLDPENIAKKAKSRLPEQSDPAFVTVQGRKLEVRRIAGANRDAPVLVFLHEGLGSVSMWRDFPEKVAHATGCSALVYSRYGYGESDVLGEPRGVDYMHVEALEALPALLEELSIRDPVLVGHSDGGSIALIYAGARGRAKGLVVLAPHVFVEDISVKSIAEAKTAFETTDLPQKLGRYHADAAKTFWGWNHIWLHPDFRGWNIEEFLPRVHCPVHAGIQGFLGSTLLFEPLDESRHRFEHHAGLVAVRRVPAIGEAQQLDRAAGLPRDRVQLRHGPVFVVEALDREHGAIHARQDFDDEYGTMAQLEAIARQTGGPIELLRLTDCRHSPHRDQPGAVIEAMSRFIERLEEQD